MLCKLYLLTTLWKKSFYRLVVKLVLFKHNREKIREQFISFYLFSLPRYVFLYLEAPQCFFPRPDETSPYTPLMSLSATIFICVFLSQHSVLSVVLIFNGFGKLIILFSYRLKPVWICVDAEIPQNQMTWSPLGTLFLEWWIITTETVNSITQVLCRVEDLRQLCKLPSCCSMSFPVGRVGGGLHAWVTFRACSSASAGAYKQLRGLSV